MVQRLDLGHGELAVFLGGRLGIDLVEVLGDRRIVDLQHEPGVDDRLVFLPHGVGAGEDELVVALVMAVADAGATRRTDRGHEAFADTARLERCLEVGNVGCDGVVSGIGHGLDGERPARQARSRGDSRFGIGIGCREPGAVAPIGEGREHGIARARSLHRQGVAIDVLDPEAAEAREGIAPPGAIVDLRSHRFAVLAVTGDGDAGGHLPPHDVADRAGEPVLKGGLVDFTRFALPVGFYQRVGARQAAGVAGEYRIDALAHDQRPLNLAGLRFSAKARAASPKSSER
jgi:hypothetical protein